MRQEKLKEAKEKFEFVVKHYRYAMAWDPSRGFIGRWPEWPGRALTKLTKCLAVQAKEPKEPLKPARP